MEIRNLLSFVSAAESGSMANAARVCHITPSAVCKHIKDLECELGVQLLVRGKNSVKLTDYGEVFFLRAKNIIRETQKAKEEIADVKGELCGELRIGVGCFVETMIGRAIAEFMNRYPKVRICVQYNYAHELNRMLRSNEIDVAFSMNEPYSNEGIESVKCFQFRLYAIMSKKSAKDFCCPRLTYFQLFRNDFHRYPCRILVHHFPPLPPFRHLPFRYQKRQK